MRWKHVQVPTRAHIMRTRGHEDANANGDSMNMHLVMQKCTHIRSTLVCLQKTARHFVSFLTDATVAVDKVSLFLTVALVCGEVWHVGHGETAHARD